MRRPHRQYAGLLGEQLVDGKQLVDGEQLVEVGRRIRARMGHEDEGCRPRREPERRSTGSVEE